ncbi:MAG TPA: glycoside hydrolase family 172 protein [Mucilaginibacter sp.]|nr:glycoside hydrolase family 172 protein [Mucilaginibacter sp.]
MPDSSVKTRWYTYENVNGVENGGGKANFGRKGAPLVFIPAGKSLVIADIKQSGTIRRIWMTLIGKMNYMQLRGMKIEMYWDDAKKPAVQAPLGDFFCQSLGQMVAFQNAFFSSPQASSLNCTIPMPFRKNAKIVLVNESNTSIPVYYEVDATLGDKHDDKTLYFHAYWRRENPVTIRKDFTILPKIEGKGRFLGCNLGMIQDSCCTMFWWGEGEVKIYLDGDREYPTLVGTGTEDYIGSGYGQALFNHQYQGDQFISQTKNAYGFYRLHVPDPVYFHKDIRVTIQDMGGPGWQSMVEAINKNPGMKFMKSGNGEGYYNKEELEAKKRIDGKVERTDDLCATAYWYMAQPENELPPIAGIGERIKGLSAIK